MPLPERGTSSRVLLVGLVVALAAAGFQLRCWDLHAPFSFFTDDQDNWYGFENAAFYGVLARNQVKLGFVDTRFAGVLRGGDLQDSMGESEGNQFQTRREYYVRHPPLFTLMLAVLYKVFGVSDPLTRLLPIAFSVLAIFGVARIATRLWGFHAGWLSALWMALLPAGSFYGSLVDIQGSVLMGFSVLAANAYLSFLRSDRSRDLAWTLVWTALACLTDWPAYFVAGLITLHQMFWGKAGGKLRGMVAPIGVVAGLLGLHIAQIASTKLGQNAGEEAQGGMVETLIHHSPWGLYQDKGVDGLGMLARSFVEACHLLLTVPVTLAAIAGALIALAQLRKGKARREDVVPALLAGLAFLHIVVFAEIATRHLYWYVYLLPPAALYATYFTLKLAKTPRLSRPIATALASVFVVGSSALAWHQTHSLRFPPHNYLYHLGKVIGEHTTPEQKVVTCEMDHIAVTWYADRWIFGLVSEDRMTGIKDWDKAVKAFSRMGKAAFVVPETSLYDGHRHDNLLRALQAHYGHKTVETPIGRVWVFDLQDH